MQYTKKRNIILTSIIFLLGILAGGKILTDKQIIFSGPEHVLVTEVIDGDTIRIQLSETRFPLAGETKFPLVRLIGIDAPEKNKCYYQESKEYLENLILNKSVRLEKDIAKKDKYDRWLRYIILPDLKNEKQDFFVNQELIKNGYALASSQAPNNRYAKLFSEAQENAIKNNLGLWQDCYYLDEINLNKELDVPPSDDKCIIKGNVSSRHSTKTYLLPECGNYSRTKIDPRSGDKYFCTEQEALAAGFKKSSCCPK